MCYLAAGSQWIQQLDDLKRAHSYLVASEADLKCQVAELERTIWGFDKKYDLLAAEKEFVEDVWSSLEAQVDSLTQSNEGLMIQNESLERDLSDRDWELCVMQLELESLRVDRDWMLHVSVVRVMDKLIEHLEFIGDVGWIPHVAFVAGEESGRPGQKAEIDVRTYKPEGSDSHSSHTSNLEYALLAFPKMDYTAILGLG